MLLRFLPLVIAIPSASSACLAATDGLSIYAIDVGQGASTLIVGPTQDGERVALLVHAGDFTRSDTAPPDNARQGQIIQQAEQRTCKTRNTVHDA